MNTQKKPTKTVHVYLNFTGLSDNFIYNNKYISFNSELLDVLITQLKVVNEHCKINRQILLQNKDASI